MLCKCDCCNAPGGVPRYLASEIVPDVRIVILQRGWVAVGIFQKGEDGARFLKNASIIRIWGTTKGLGEVCAGPTSSTKLDPCGDMAFHEFTIVSTLKADAKGWKNYVAW